MSQRSRNATYKRPGQARWGAEVPVGKHAQTAPRLIGYGILLIALVLIVVGSAFA
jgi:hypothetical protein